MITEFGHGTGGIPSPTDKRDYHVSNIGMATAPYDWSTPFELPDKPTKNQGQSFSCGGQSGSYPTDGSAKCIYAQKFLSGGGMWGRDICDVIKKQIIASESACPSYESGNPPSESFMERVQDLPAIVPQTSNVTYANINLDIDSVASAITNNFAVIIGVVGNNNGSWLTTYPSANIVGSTWNHWLWACGAKKEDGIKYIKIKNSWGDSVGDHGSQWLSQDFFPNLIFEAWAISKNVKYIFNNNMYFGMTNNADVHALQVRLGMPPEYQTGNFFGKTMLAVMSYQRSNGISATGFAGPITRAKLNAS